jgi:hypothetical protein
MQGACTGCWAADDAVTISMHGEIKPACGLSQQTSIVDLGNILEPGNKTIWFVLNCNAPFAYSIDSRFGGLKHTSVENAPNGFTTLLNYTITTNIITTSALINDTCTSRELIKSSNKCSLSDSGTGISLHQTVSFIVSWQQFESVPLAGKYTDVISISLWTRY